MTMHVLIIGGGIGGLCLAQGLRRRGVSVAVCERDRTPDARLQGYRLSIEPPGSAALHDCLPPELWQILVATSGDQGERMGVFDEQLRQLMEEDAKPDRADPASGSHAVSRVTFRQVLLAGLDDAVHFGKEFHHHVPAGDGTVTAHFADGSSARGDLLVGADGARSRVRRQLLPDARRIDTPAIGVGGKLPLTRQTAQWLPDRIMATKNMVLPPRDFLFTAVFRRREQPADVTARLWDRLAAAGLDADQPGLAGRFLRSLTPREAEVAGLVVEGLTDREIARRLLLSPCTVMQHVKSVYRKLGVDSRVALTRLLTGASPGSGMR